MVVVLPQETLRIVQPRAGLAATLIVVRSSLAIR
jgi:hypothetical protein